MFVDMIRLFYENHAIIGQLLVIFRQPYKVF